MASWKDKRKIMHRYDVTAKMYNERYEKEQKAKYHKALENVNDAGSVLLDVGCGSGLLFSEVAAHADLVVGVDISRKLLLKAKAQARDLPNAFVLQADADNLPFRQVFFGVVFAFTVLQNKPKPAETLKELKRVVSTCGMVVVTGLKKSFSLNIFMDLLDESGLRLVSFVDDASINCYIAVLAV